MDAVQPTPRSRTSSFAPTSRGEMPPLALAGSLSARQMSVGAEGEASLSEYGAVGAIPASARGNSKPSARLRPTSAGRSKKEYEARRKRKEAAAKHERLTELREEDTRMIRDRAARAALQREQQFEKQLEALAADDHLRVHAARQIRDYERERARKRYELYQNWDNEVMRRVDHHLMKFMTDEPPPVEEGWREQLRRSDCPVKRQVYQHQQEEQFSRKANAVVGDAALREIEDVGLPEHIRRRELQASVVATRENSRPVLPVPLWAQQHHYASRFGYFAQGTERAEKGELGFHSSRRMGVDRHLPHEEDGVPMAGKTKNRFERNLLGMLEGTTAKYGEAYIHKRDHGPGCAAPLQDHYTYETGTAIVDAEFPVGKRMFPGLRH